MISAFTIKILTQQQKSLILSINFNMECILCAQESEFIGVGECNHQPMCFRCIYKMRVISKNNQCPICKVNLKIIIIMDKFTLFETFKNNVLPDKSFADIFYSSEAGRLAFEKLTEYKCFVKIQGKPCKYDKKFPSIAFLKKHLKQDHNRYICQICFEKKTCVLQQQKLYTFKALNKHMDKGDIDEFGNVTFMHPYCGFCKKNFFDEDQFKRHVNVEHILCNVCGKQEKYRYYKNYDGLQTHFKMSHYVCNDENCLAKKFIAFRNAEQLRIHRLQMHDRNYSNKKIDMKQLCGFQYEGHNPDDEIIVLKDKQGIDMEDQFLNLKKCKNKVLGEADQQIDTLLDPRIFYDYPLDEDEHFEEAFILKHRTSEDRPQTNQKKKKYIEKADLQKDKPIIAKENENFYFEELSLINSFHMSKLNYDDFENKLKNILLNEDVSKLSALRGKLHKKQIKPQQFFDQFLRLMKNSSLRSAYSIFPHYLRTVTNDDLKQQLQQIYIRGLKKIPPKTQNILFKCEYYSDLFKLFLHQIECNIENRIKRKQLSIKKPVKRCKERLFQIIGVVRRLKIEQMAKFKFATNFGIQQDTVDFILGTVLKKKFSDFQEKLNKIATEEILDCYIFVKLCFQAIKHKKNLLTEKNKIHQNILEDFLFQRPYLQAQFGLKKEELKNLEDQIEFEKNMEEKKAKNTLKQIQRKNEKKGFSVKTDFNLVDKGDFPDLVVDKKQQVKKSDNLKEVIQFVKEKPATYQKKINQLFPTLGQSPPSPVKQEYKPVQVKPEQKTEKAWWQKINEPKKIEIDQQQQKVRVRKGKKKEKWVSVKGVFN